jgi:hypothetical protein
MTDLPSMEAQFPAGTPVCITMLTHRRGRDLESRVIGTVEAWDSLPTGSWYAHGKDDRLWLDRVRIRRVDGEITLLVIDDATAISRLEVAQA